MRFILLAFLVAIFSVGTAQAADSVNRDVCDDIPSDCMIDGKLDKECLCRVWCKAGCGGSACNCDILPKSNNDTSPKKLVNEKACQERIDKILADKGKVN